MLQCSNCSLVLRKSGDYAKFIYRVLKSPKSWNIGAIMSTSSTMFFILMRMKIPRNNVRMH